MATSFPMLAGHGHSLQSGEALAPAAQGAALLMTFIVAAILLAMAGGIFVLVRRARRGESPEQILLRELREDSKRQKEKPEQNTIETGPTPEPPPAGWEKDADWWKEGQARGKNPPETSG